MLHVMQSKITKLPLLKVTMLTKKDAHTKGEQMNNYCVTYHLVNGEKLSKNVQAEDARDLQSMLIMDLDVGTPVSIKENWTIKLLPANSILYFEIKEL